MSTQPTRPPDRFRRSWLFTPSLVACFLFVAHAFVLWRGGPAYILTQFALAIAVPIAAVALLVGKSRKPSSRIAVFALLAVVTVSFLATPLAPYIVDLGSEHHVKQVSNIDRIYAWGMELIAKPIGTVARRSVTEHWYVLRISFLRPFANVTK